MSAASLAQRYPSIRLMRAAARARLPRPLEGAATRDQSLELFGQPLSMRRELPTLTFGNYVRPGSIESLATLAGRMSSLLDPAMHWDDLAQLRAQWQGPLLLKGILHPEDARRAVALGARAAMIA